MTVRPPAGVRRRLRQPPDHIQQRPRPPAPATGAGPDTGRAVECRGKEGALALPSGAAEGEPPRGPLGQLARSRACRLFTAALVLYVCIPPGHIAGEQDPGEPNYGQALPSPPPHTLYVRAPQGSPAASGAYLLMPQIDGMCALKGGTSGRSPSSPPWPFWVAHSVADEPVRKRRWIYAERGQWRLGRYGAAAEYATRSLPSTGGPLEGRSVPLALPQDVPAAEWRRLGDGPPQPEALRVSAAAPRYDGARSEVSVVGVGHPALAGRYVLIEGPDPPADSPWPTWVRAGAGSAASTVLFSLPSAAGARWAIGIAPQQLPTIQGLPRPVVQLGILAYTEPHGGWMPHELPSAVWRFRDCVDGEAGDDEQDERPAPPVTAGVRMPPQPWDPLRGDALGQRCSVRDAPQLAVTDRRLPQALFLVLPERERAQREGRPDPYPHLVEVEGRYLLLEPTSASDPFPEWGCGDLRIRRDPDGGGWAVSAADNARLRLRTGALQRQLGGVYSRSNQTANEMPVWFRDPVLTTTTVPVGHGGGGARQQSGDGGVSASGYLYGAANGCWTVTPNKQDVGSDRGYIHSPLHHSSANPVGVPAWKVWNGSAWVADAEVEVVHEPPGASAHHWLLRTAGADRSQALHPAEYGGPWVTSMPPYMRLDDRPQAVEVSLTLSCPYPNPDSPRHEHRCRRRCCPQGVPLHQCNLDTSV
eukprot:TRINITY_DN64985_c0_g1_i1.p1 TRINITY_DN64985_c0_g1~~TRINITY_DN64985_c0_g1_i1.p1  ORF type:complete len:701 (+),score=150.40 TRINITY_DN64985_c0_g1_i1:91-2193(+)